MLSGGLGGGTPLGDSWASCARAGKLVRSTEEQKQPSENRGIAADRTHYAGDPKICIACHLPVRLHTTCGKKKGNGDKEEQCLA